MSKPTLTIKGKLQNCLSKISQKSATLTIWGFIVCCTNDETNAVEQKFDWGNALIDAAITSAITFFSALGGGTIAGISDVNILESAAIAALSQFFVFLALKRGLVKPEKVNINDSFEDDVNEDLPLKTGSCESMPEAGKTFLRLSPKQVNFCLKQHLNNLNYLTRSFQINISYALSVSCCSAVGLVMISRDARAS